jgi:hypothetical protein
MVAGVHRTLIFVDVGQDETLEPSSNIRIQRVVEWSHLKQELKLVVGSGTSF